jgi:hypothetical protein
MGRTGGIEWAPDLREPFGYGWPCQTAMGQRVKRLSRIGRRPDADAPWIATNEPSERRYGSLVQVQASLD